MMIYSKLNFFRCSFRPVFIQGMTAGVGNWDNRMSRGKKTGGELHDSLEMLHREEKVTISGLLLQSWELYL